MSAFPRIVVVGGTGHFGTRICRRLALQGEVDVILTSRSLSRAQALAASINREPSSSSVTAASLDQEAATLEEDLARLQADIVVHTAGPYQAQDCRVARACIAAGCHYVDLADARGFVAGFGDLDDAARAAGVIMISGASTLPGISSAVVDEHRRRFRQIEQIETTIAPAHQTPRGLGTVRAVLSYCGKPVDTWRDGNWHTVYGWQDLRLQRRSVLGRRRLSGACDVPDLVLFPDYVPGLLGVSFYAALEAPWEQLALWLMAGLTRAGVVSDWSRFAPSFARVSKWLIRLGSQRGGMQIRIAGVGLDGKSRNIDWYLVAENNHGPEIPCTPAIVVLKKILDRSLSKPGARACLGVFTVDELMQELSAFDVSVAATELE